MYNIDVTKEEKGDEIMKRYFKVTCVRGHAGTGHSTDITFVFEAANLLEATKQARRMPSVKHSRGILCGCEIDAETYELYRARSAYARAEGRY